MEQKLAERGAVYVIAEAGVNHNGDLATALELIDAAKAAGADAVKFQTFTADAIAVRDAPKPLYQLVTTSSEESQHEMLRRLELSPESHLRLQAHAQDLGIEFLSTPFDRNSLSFLATELGLPKIKISSSDVTNLPLLVDVGRLGVEVILSTGMATLGEIEIALRCLVFGSIEGRSLSSRADLDEAFQNPNWRRILDSRVSLLHCTSDYPAPLDSVNLAAMSTLRDAFGVRVGYSDHTDGSTVAIAAVARGAEVIEKHLTLDRQQSGPDHAASIEPDDFRLLVQNIRETELCIGRGDKGPTSSEVLTRKKMRKGLYAARDIESGHILEEKDILWARPAGDDVDYFQWLGKPAPNDLQMGDPLCRVSRSDK